MEEFDVVIIGAGLAGLQCAKLLSQRDAKILLVDRKINLARGIHTTGIFVRKSLEDFDFPAVTLGKPVKHVTLYSPKLKSINLESEKDEFRVGKMGKLYESFLSDCVANSVEFANETRYISSLAENFETIVKLERNGKSREVKTKVLVGADGAQSRVAKDLGLDENKEWIVGYEEVYKGDTFTDEPRLHCFLDAELAPGYLAWISNDGEEVHIGVGGYAEKFNPREALNEFKRKVSSQIIDVNNIELFETRGGRIPVGGVLRRITGRRGLLIGDAAGAVSPLTAGGLDPCLRLSKFAAEIICKRLKTDDTEVLLDYSGEVFRSRFISRLWMRRLIAIVSNQKILELGFNFLQTGIGKKFANHVFFGRGSFPDIEVKNKILEKSLNT